MNKEKRSITSELRVATESRLVEGYALLFNEMSRDLGGFIETIDAGALEGVIEKSDVFCLLNHSDDRGILARSKNGEGSLILEVDEVGLKYLFEAPKTSLGDEVLEYLNRGDITGSSFAFTIKQDDWVEQEDGRYLRTIKAFDMLYDVSPVFNPAYTSTSVAKRNLDSIKEQVKQKKDKELTEYFNALKSKLKAELQ